MSTSPTTADQIEQLLGISANPSSSCAVVTKADLAAVASFILAAVTQPKTDTDGYEYLNIAELCRRTNMPRSRVEKLLEHPASLKKIHMNHSRTRTRYSLRDFVKFAAETTI